MRAMPRAVAVGGAATLTLLSISGANATTRVVDFDDTVAPCNFDEATPLTNEYEAQGLTFSGLGTRLNECATFFVSGYSSPNFLAFNGGLPDRGPPETITFRTAASRVSLLVGTGSGGGPVVLTAFNGTVPVDSDTVELPFRDNQVGPVLPISVDAPRITSVVLDATLIGPTGSGGLGDIFIADDLTWADAALTPQARAGCMNGGWRDVADDQGRPFRNEGQCVAFVNHPPTK